MTVRIGLAAGRTETVLDVAALAAAMGAEVTSLDPVVGLAVDPGLGLTAVVVDVLAPDVVAAASGGTSPNGGVGPPVVVAHRTGERDQARLVAARLAADHVVELPLGATWLAAQLQPASPAPLLAVIGAAGGIGTTTLAIACAASVAPDCLLVDADPGSAGLDLPLGIGDDVGGRWNAIPETDGPLVADSVRAALPTVEGISVLTGPVPRHGSRPARILEVGRSAFRHTVVDLGRAIETSPIGAGDAVVVLCPATLPGVVATRRVLADLPTERALVAVRPTGWLAVSEVSDQLGGVPIVEVGRISRLGELADCADLLSGRSGRALRKLGHSVWAELG